MLSVDRRGNVLVIKLRGELREEHLEGLESMIEGKMEENDGLPLLVDLRKYDGPENLTTAWHHMKFIAEYGDRVEKIAVVGALDWQKLGTLLVSPFTRAKERFFEPDEIDDALRWLRS